MDNRDEKKVEQQDDMENTEENGKKRWKIWKKGKLKWEMIQKIWKKPKLNSENMVKKENIVK